MADFPITEQKRYTTPHFSKIIRLDAGGKLSDDAELLAVAAKTVPSGYKAKVRVDIVALVEKL